ncbi:RCC1 and BTB domain-containing protein 1-like [Cimex lectularius]|uniref:RCC1-like domain-containing protein n=1 Tax=Cimex lectularius TaxID=79782 RepID=A0A8I6SC48_CIMLE|nr:RCC1 and BTB domain-containing protein 1-like [Cimex lectularius]
MHRLTAPKTLWAWGNNNFGQLGLDSEEPYFSVPEQVDLKSLDLKADEIKGIYTGTYNTFMVLKNGIVYGTGLNNVAQLGANPLIVRKFTLLDNLDDYCIRDMAVGYEVIYAITDNGTLIGWGSNALGKLSLDPNKFLTCRIPVEIYDDVKKIAVGNNFVIILTNEGEVLTFGDGRMGQLGRECSEKFWKVKPMQFDMPVRSITCGQFHGLLITENNRIFTWGSNNWGQLGIEPDKIMNPLPVELTFPVPIDRKTKIRCGWRHSAVFFSKGQIFQWGDNNQKQFVSGTGLEYFPFQFREEFIVNKVAIGFAHTLVIIEKGIIMAWGDNTSGSCGIGTITNLTLPLKYRTGVKTAAIRIFAGYKQSFALAL